MAHTLDHMYTLILAGTPAWKAYMKKCSDAQEECKVTEEGHIVVPGCQDVEWDSDEATHCEDDYTGSEDDYSDEIFIPKRLKLKRS